MDRASLRQTLLGLLEQETGKTYSQLNDTDNLKETLGLDSVDLIGLVLQVENTFNIRIDSDELQPVQTVGDLLDLLGRHTGPQSAAA
jgi:acyl carrier protein